MSDAKRDSTVGFIGLGMMGAPMAENIAKAGLPLVVHDIDPAKTARLVALGAEAASGAADVARRARTVISMVDTTAQAQEVIVGPAGVIAGAQPGDAVITMSTIDPLAVQAMHAQLAAKGVGMIDAPVSGMEKGAREGTLRAFVGGDAATLEQCRPALAPMTSEIIHIGPIGQGILMKLINNMLVQVNRVIVTEALVLGAKAGLDGQTMVDVIGKSTGGATPAFQATAPRAVARDFRGIRMDITYKDLELQTALARSLSMPLFFANLALQVVQMGRAAGLGGEDVSALVKVYEQLGCTSLAPRH